MGLRKVLRKLFCDNGKLRLKHATVQNLTDHGCVVVLQFNQPVVWKEFSLTQWLFKAKAAARLEIIERQAMRDSPILGDPNKLRYETGEPQKTGYCINVPVRIR